MSRVDSMPPFIRAIPPKVAGDGPRPAHRLDGSGPGGGTRGREDVHGPRRISGACARGQLAPTAQILRRAMSGALRSEHLEALLQQLGPDREIAGTQYEDLRRRLVAV